MRGSAGRSVGKSLLRAVWGGASGGSPRVGDSRSAECLARLVSRGSLDAQASGRLGSEASAACSQQRRVSCSAYSSQRNFESRRGAGNNMPPRKVQPQPQGETEPSNDDSAEPTQPFKVADIPIETRKDMLTAQIKRAKIELRDGYEAGRHNRQGHCPACGGGPARSFPDCCPPTHLLHAPASSDGVLCRELTPATPVCGAKL